jgi:hypothetical protein
VVTTSPPKAPPAHAWQQEGHRRHHRRQIQCFLKNPNMADSMLFEKSQYGRFSCVMAYAGEEKGEEHLSKKTNFTVSEKK